MMSPRAISPRPIRSSMKRGSMSTAVTEVSDLTGPPNEVFIKETEQPLEGNDDLIDRIAKKVAEQLLQAQQDGRSVSGQSLNSRDSISKGEVSRIAEALVLKHSACPIRPSLGDHQAKVSIRASDCSDFWCAELLESSDKDEDSSSEDDASVVSDITELFDDNGFPVSQVDVGRHAAAAGDEEEYHQDVTCPTVRFGSLTVREYNQILGDNPAVTNGAPLSIGWEYRELPTLHVNQFEKIRRNRRRVKGLVLNRRQREIILRRQGYDSNEILEGIRYVHKLQKQRSQTVSNLGSQKVEEALSSVSRRVKGMLRFGSKKQQQV